MESSPTRKQSASQAFFAADTAVVTIAHCSRFERVYGAFRRRPSGVTFVDIS